MFRTAVLRTASAARAAIRPAASLAVRRAIAPRAAAVSVMPKIQSFQSVRMYSAGGALNKEEVEGRIISLLQGFDKVSSKLSAGEDVGKVREWASVNSVGNGLTVWMGLEGWMD